ncbi:hypothetical protein HZ994_07250 [Akkermansiaceae bacterium]|nr:hypothetical protein HZ994_07250 [Akkermansiaceae bacterium]
MNRSSFIAACALMVLAMTLVARIVLGGAGGAPGEIADANDNGVKPSASPIRQPAASTSHVDRGKARGSSGAEGFSVRSAVRDAAQAGGETVPSDGKAAKVGTYALARLNELDSQLHLTAAQKRRLFPLLARNSPGFDPSMVIGTPSGVLHPADAPSSATAGAGQDISTAILAELDPGQQAIYEDMLIDDGLWWTEIINRIDADFQESTRDGAAPEEDAGTGENLFDLLNQ